MRNTNLVIPSLIISLLLFSPTVFATFISYGLPYPIDNVQSNLNNNGITNLTIVSDVKFAVEKLNAISAPCTIGLYCNQIHLDVSNTDVKITFQRGIGQNGITPVYDCDGSLATVTFKLQSNFKDDYGIFYLVDNPCPPTTTYSVGGYIQTLSDTNFVRVDNARVTLQSASIINPTILTVYTKSDGVFNFEVSDKVVSEGQILIESCKDNYICSTKYVSPINRQTSIVLELKLESSDPNLCKGDILFDGIRTLCCDSQTNKVIKPLFEDNLEQKAYKLGDNCPTDITNTDFSKLLPLILIGAGLFIFGRKR